jgi:hypothetical protein
MKLLRFLSLVIFIALSAKSAAADEIYLPIGGIESTPQPATVSTVNTQGDDPSLAIGADGLPIISFVSFDCSSPYTCFRVVRCTDVACTSVDPAVEVDVGWETTIRIGSDQLPVIAYASFDPDQQVDHIKVAHCDDVACAQSTKTIIHTPSEYSSPHMVIGSDGLPFIITTGFGGLQMFHCEDVGCTEVTTATIEDDFYSNASGVVAVGSDGMPLVAYSTGTAIKLAHCEDVTCSSYAVNVIADSGTNMGPSLVIGADGLPLISYYYMQICCIGDGKLKVAHCQDASCEEVITTTVDQDGDVGAQNAALSRGGGAPFIAYIRFEKDEDGFVTDVDFRVADCDDNACASSTVESWGIDYSYPSPAMGSDGLVVMAVSSFDGVSVVHCNDFACTAPE